MNLNIILFCLLLFSLVSCGIRNGKGPDISDSVLSGPDKSIDTNLLSDERNNDSVVGIPGIFDVLQKMSFKARLSDVEYALICNFLLENKDEEKSEEVGYVLFEYLKANRVSNQTFKFYLLQKDSVYRTTVTRNLVDIMCLDLGEEYHTYSKLIEDFPLFENDLQAQAAFNRCMTNLAE